MIIIIIISDTNAMKKIFGKIDNRRDEKENEKVSPGRKPISRGHLMP